MWKGCVSSEKWKGCVSREKWKGCVLREVEGMCDFCSHLLSEVGWSLAVNLQ